MLTQEHVALGKTRFWVFSDNNTLLLNIVVEKYYIGKNRISYRIQKKNIDITCMDEKPLRIN